MQSHIEGGCYGGGVQSPALKRVIRDVLQALLHMHQSGVVHNDLHPGNVMVGPDGKATVIDLGKSQSIGGKHEQELDLGGADIEYQAPEGQDHPHPSQDIFRVGIIVHQTITGVRLGEAMEMRTNWRTGEKEECKSQYIKLEQLDQDLRELNTRPVNDLPPVYVDFITRLTAPDPDNRITAQQALSHPFLRN